DDGVRLEAALERFGNDGARLEAALGQFGNDGARLEAVLGQFGDDGARLEAALAAFGNDAGRLEAALVAFGNDGARLETALGQFGNDGARLERLLRLGINAVDLELYILMAGGQSEVALLEQLLIKADALGDVRRVEPLLNIASGDAGKFRELGDAAQAFPPVRTPVPNPQPSNLVPTAADPPGSQAFTGSNTTHFLNEHTFSFYDFAKTGNQQTFWPPGTTDAHVVQALEQAITAVRASGVPMPAFGFRIVPIPGVNGVTAVRFGVRPGLGGTFIGQFFPTSGTGILTLLKNELDAIARIVIP
ncbi:MAG TPA: hypothetical protein VJ302_15055, partial [Blastocatellia bacterium]|nr:hypothetical protein [Blastocatellia bacterium]